MVLGEGEGSSMEPLPFPYAFRTAGQIAQCTPRPYAAFFGAGVPYGIRTRVTAVKGRCPRPLDEGDPGARSMYRPRAGKSSDHGAASPAGYFPIGCTRLFRRNASQCAA